MKKMSVFCLLVAAGLSVANGPACRAEALLRGASEVSPASALSGRWVYEAPASEYRGNDLLASLAVSALGSQLEGYYAKAGLTRGRLSLIFGREEVVAILDEKKAVGHYAYDAASGRLTVTLPLQGKSVRFTGSTAIADGVLTLLFDVGELLQVLRSVAPQIEEDAKWKVVIALLEEYPGMMIGCKFRR